MFTGVIIFATAVLAVGGQDHYSNGHETSSHSIIQHDKSHYNHNQELSYHSSPALIHSDGRTYYRSKYYVAPMTHTAAITHATPITHIAPSAHHSHHHTPIHRARVIHIPVVHHYSPIFTEHTHIHAVAPVIHHATPQHTVPAITLQHASANNNEYQYTSEHQDDHVHPKYEYEYSVHDSHTGDIKSQNEASDGTDVNGVYSAQEADDSFHTVNPNSHRYTGFNADVHYSQPSTHDQSASEYYHH